MVQSRSCVGFWGKIRVGEEGCIEKWLSLSRHCLDVARVFEALANLPSFRRKLEVISNQTLSATQVQRLAVIALLHDVGKANLAFQEKPFNKRIRAGHVGELAPIFVDEKLLGQFISAIDANIVCSWFATPESAQSFLTAAWSHHGKPHVFQDIQAADHELKSRYWHAKDGRDPFQAIADLLSTARANFPAAFEPGGPVIPDSTALQHRFSGLVMLADWLGSHPSFFPLQAVADAAPRRTPHDAHRALRRVGLDVCGWQSYLSANRTAFLERFGFNPRALQSELDLLPTDGRTNHLLIAEAETGSGKTEAALARFLRLFAAREVDALYFALPTRVAAREIYGRIDEYVSKLFPSDDRPPVLLAVPGYARVDNIPIERLLPDEDTRHQDDAEQARRERLWAAEHPKRFLAATIAVGTIDQALLSALQAPHAHLRSVCLDRSLLVVDEVHASDPYMSRLLHNLLDHHLGVGGHALLLSATLGSRARAQFTGHPEPGLKEAIATPYPAVTDTGGVPRGLPVDPAPPKSVVFDPRPDLEQPEALLPEIAEALGKGARVLVVMNTVSRAIALQRAAEEREVITRYLFTCRRVIAPHHGRFAPVDREVLDQDVTDALGKHSPASARLLIGTQTLEQSLDIDADLLITDLCPIDVLLQRIGRLHRHRERKRPSGFELARCVLLVPAVADLETLLDAKGEAIGTAKRTGLGSVYLDVRVLQLTRDLAATHPGIEIPRDNRWLVEEATHSERLATLNGTRWEKHAQNVEGSDLAKGVRADYACLTSLYRQPFGNMECLFRDNEEARTRLGLDALRVPLDQAVMSPFGQTLTEIVIPGHLADKKTTEECATVVAEQADDLILTHGNHSYRYFRYGLEKLDE